MITADEFKFGLMTAYVELEAALDRIESDYGLSDEVRSSEEAVDILLRAPDAAKCVRAACDDFNQKAVALQRASFQVLRGGRQ